ncbi:Endonuclease/Exonuclease/phosphatase family protein [compost metagenome]
MAELYAALPASQGYAIPSSAIAPPMGLPTNAAPASYQGLLDRLHLASQTPPPAPALPLTPAASNPPSLPGLSGLFQQLKALLDRWLTPAVPSAPAPPAPRSKKTDFVISSFNVLGSSHTTPSGEKPGMAAGTTRIRSAVELLDRHDVDVVGFQELQGDQLKEFLKVAGDQYAVYPGFALGKRETVNSLAWRKDTWELVKPGSINIPYFDGHQRKMPVVLLRHRETGQEAYFANFHNPANTRKFGDQERWRDAATEKQIAMVNRLRRETGLPVFVTGDMNEREEYYDKMTRGAAMVSADTGPKGQRPKKMGIDWIFGSAGVKFSDYTQDRSALVKKTSDHPMIVSKARITGS